MANHTQLIACFIVEEMHSAQITVIFRKQRAITSTTCIQEAVPLLKHMKFFILNPVVLTMGTVPKDKAEGLNVHKITSKMELLSKYM
jgi:hypothetical protein